MRFASKTPWANVTMKTSATAAKIHAATATEPWSARNLDAAMAAHAYVDHLTTSSAVAAGSTDSVTNAGGGSRKGPKASAHTAAEAGDNTATQLAGSGTSWNAV